jgi:hypothetical protein
VACQHFPMLLQRQHMDDARIELQHVAWGFVNQSAMAPAVDSSEAAPVERSSDRRSLVPL